MEKKIFSVALVHRLCPVCTQENEEGTQIIMNKRLSQSQASKVDAMNGKAIGFTDQMCANCKKELNKYGKSAVYLIEYDQQKTDDKSNPYRTGRVFIVKNKTVWKKSTTADWPENRFAFVPEM